VCIRGRVSAPGPYFLASLQRLGIDTIDLYYQDELLALCDEPGIAFVAYSPLGRGFLTGAIRSREATIPVGAAAGSRYPEGAMRALGR